MSETNDQSHLDRKYFIDEKKYNCPFCNRKSITYSVIDKFYFNWSNDRFVLGYLVRCGGDTCKKVSLHLTNYDIEIYSQEFWAIPAAKSSKRISELNLDDLFFYHQPTTFFTLDDRINDRIRKLISEAEGCARMNYLVGASGCLRKAIYELLDLEKVPTKNVKGQDISYEERIKILKDKYGTVPPEYFDALASIQGMTSQQLHEGGWTPWTQEEFNFLIETTKEVLTEIYVRPKEKSSILEKILALKPQKKENQETGG